MLQNSLLPVLSNYFLDNNFIFNNKINKINQIIIVYN